MDEDQVDLALRYSALEWIVEQMLANMLLNNPDADRFLDQLSANDGRAWTQTVEGVEDARPELAERLYEHIGQITEKVRRRVHQGVRRTGPLDPSRQSLAASPDW